MPYELEGVNIKLRQFSEENRLGDEERAQAPFGNCGIHGSYWIESPVNLWVQFPRFAEDDVAYFPNWTSSTWGIDYGGKLCLCVREIPQKNDL